MPLDVVWFKRDLRLTDHAPLFEAACAAVEMGNTLLPLYVIEPAYWRLPDTSARQWAAIHDALAELDASLSQRGSRLVLRSGAVVEVLSDLHQRYGISALWSHQETGNLWTYERDRAVKRWTGSAGIAWIERPQFGVTRGLRDRNGWARRWDRFMAAPRVEPPKLAPVPVDIAADLLPEVPVDFRPEQAIPCPERQPGDRVSGLSTLTSFLQDRGEPYRRAMSTPVDAYDACSRLSVPLCVGSLSLREVTQAAHTRLADVRSMPREDQGEWAGALNSFIGRLHWHCHFIQKLEDAPHFETRNVHPGYDGIRSDGPFPERHLAWSEGMTGLPFVDACMRALRAAGWMNFRMRAMLMAVASYHLWLHWREPGLHLARLFTDYEPGIHWNQCQMQSGTTGINTVRIYNPVKQGYDQDPSGTFIRRWVPELSPLPDTLVHEPWRLSPLEMADLGFQLGRDYPYPIIDHRAAAKAARDQIWAVRRDPAFTAEANRIQAKHGSRKSGLSPTKGRRESKPRSTQETTPGEVQQMTLMLDGPS